jgi:hypothetical protein
MRLPRPSARVPLFLAALFAVGLALPSGGDSAAEPPKDPPAAPDPQGGDQTDPDDPDDFFDSPTTFTQEQVTKAIDRGVRWLKQKQGKDGSWGGLSGGQPYGGAQGGQMYSHPAGPTALALYTLLKCKEPVKDPVIKRGFEYLKDKYEKPGGSYETSMLLLAVCATADQNKTLKASEKKAEKLKLTGAFRGWAQTLAEHLLEKRREQGWRYQIPSGGAEPGGDQDLSSTQLAALALFSAHRLGIKAKDKVWEDILRFSLAQQDSEGPEITYEDPVTKKPFTWRARGFSYIKGQPKSEGVPCGSMTACGVANVMMARFVLSDGGKKKAAWEVRSDAKIVQEAVNDGLAWLDANWSNFENPKKVMGKDDATNYYYVYWLYAFERAMDLVGDHKLGQHLWYSEMGQQLLNKQATDGSWDTNTTLEPGDVLDTCFALLFLKRATKGTIPFPSLTGGSEDEPPVDNR